MAKLEASRVAQRGVKLPCRTAGGTVDGACASLARGCTGLMWGIHYGTAQKKPIWFRSNPELASSLCGPAFLFRSIFVQGLPAGARCRDSPIRQLWTNLKCGALPRRGATAGSRSSPSCQDEQFFDDDRSRFHYGGPSNDVGSTVRNPPMGVAGRRGSRCSRSRLADRPLLEPVAELIDGGGWESAILGRVLPVLSSPSLIMILNEAGAWGCYGCRGHQPGAPMATRRATERTDVRYAHRTTAVAP